MAGKGKAKVRYKVLTKRVGFSSSIKTYLHGRSEFFLYDVTGKLNLGIRHDVSYRIVRK
jgi:hypothetical protein